MWENKLTSWYLASSKGSDFYSKGITLANFSSSANIPLFKE